MSLSKTAMASLCLTGLSLGLALVASAALSQSAPQQYEVNIETTVNGGEVKTGLTYLCMGLSQLNHPPEKVTGPRCPAQAFQRSGATLTWSADCATAKGDGKLTFSSDNSRFSGSSTIVAGGRTVVTKIDASAVDSCSL